MESCEQKSKRVRGRWSWDGGSAAWKGVDADLGRCCRVAGESGETSKRKIRHDALGRASTEGAGGGASCENSARPPPPAHVLVQSLGQGG